VKNSSVTSTRGRYDALVVDLDNTLYDWVHYYAGTLRAVLGSLAGAMGISEEELATQFRDIFTARGSLEYAFIVQELEVTQTMNPATVELLIDVAQRTSAEARRRLLRPYDGVTETLREIRAAGVRVIAVTNAPFFQAHRRLGQLGLLEHFYALGAWEGFTVPQNDPYVGQVRERLQRGEYDPKVHKHRFFRREALKPRDTMFRWALDIAEARPERALVVGDSVAKDVAPAISLGAAGAWSAYGADLDPRDFELLVKVTPWHRDEIVETYAVPPAAGYATLGQFSELREVIEL
jgi:FMN phosphatase YigB (HAD superfamily)